MSRRHSWSLLFLGPVLFGLTQSTPAQEPDHVPHWHYAWRLERDTVLHPDVRTAIDMGIEWIVNNQDDDVLGIRNAVRALFGDFGGLVSCKRNSGGR